jgi:ATP-dependent exoDNAse (exonuclease V) beta subunit
MSEPKIDQSQASIGVGYSQNVNSQQVGGTIHNYSPEQKQNLAEAAAEIQKLLEQLAQTYPTETLSEKAVVAQEAIKAIESNPTLTQRIVSAIKAGTFETLMQAIDHPVANILRAGLEGFREPS